MNFLELAKARKSTRRFLAEDIPDSVLADLIEAARQAPSGGNAQPWHFYVIRDKTVLQRIHDDSYRADWFLTAPIAIVVIADIQRSESRYGSRGRNLYCVQDTAAAVLSILLAAADVGIGTCWCGAFDEAAMREILKLQPEMRPVAMIPMGYPAADNPKPKRRPVEEIVTFI